MMDDNKADPGLGTFDKVMKLGFDMGGTPYLDAGRDFLFAQIWSRPGLDRRSRRWITITCAAAAPTPSALKLHMKAALDSGDITVEELQEFVLHFTGYDGFAKGGVAENVLEELMVERGIAYTGRRG